MKFKPIAKITTITILVLCVLLCYVQYSPIDPTWTVWLFPLGMSIVTFLFACSRYSKDV